MRRDTRDVKNLIEGMDAQERMARRQEMKSLNRILAMIRNPENYLPDVPENPFVEIGHE